MQLVSCLDLLLRWCVLRIVESNTQVLVKVLDMLKLLLDMLIDRGYKWVGGACVCGVGGAGGPLLLGLFGRGRGGGGATCHHHHHQKADLLLDGRQVGCGRDGEGVGVAGAVVTSQPACLPAYTDLPARRTPSLSQYCNPTP